jgi:hypothetical protein
LLHTSYEPKKNDIKLTFLEGGGGGEFVLKQGFKRKFIRKQDLKWKL